MSSRDPQVAEMPGFPVYADLPDPPVTCQATGRHAARSETRDPPSARHRRLFGGRLLFLYGSECHGSGGQRATQGPRVGSAAVTLTAILSVRSDAME